MLLASLLRLKYLIVQKLTITISPLNLSVLTYYLIGGKDSGGIKTGYLIAVKSIMASIGAQEKAEI